MVEAVGQGGGTGADSPSNFVSAENATSSDPTTHVSTDGGVAGGDSHSIGDLRDDGGGVISETAGVTATDDAMHRSRGHVRAESSDDGDRTNRGGRVRRFCR